MMHSVAKMILIAALMMSTFSCTTIPEPENQYLDQQAEQLVETDERMVQNCRNLGSISRSADMTKFF